MASRPETRFDQGGRSRKEERESRLKSTHRDRDRKNEKQARGPSETASSDQTQKKRARNKRPNAKWRKPNRTDIHIKSSTEWLVLGDSNGQRLLSRLDSAKSSGYFYNGKPILSLANLMPDLLEQITSNINTIVICSGAIDVVNGEHFLVGNRLEEILLRLRRIAFYEGKVFLIGPPPIRNKLAECLEVDRDLKTRKREGVAVIPLTDVLGSTEEAHKKFMDFDGLHVNARGFEKIIQAMKSPDVSHDPPKEKDVPEK